MNTLDTTSNGKPSSNPEAIKSSNCVLRAIQNHYEIPVKVKSEAKIEQEKWLFGSCVRFNRWICLPAAFMIQFCGGSLYTWSVFNKSIDTLIYGENTNTAPIVFYVAIGFYGISAAISGPWLERHGPRQACLLGASIFFLGNLVTALALYLKLMWLVFLGFGAICGPGLGISYISPVSALQKWFPDQRGLGAGFATCGFGAGSIVISKVQIPLMDAVGLPLTFVILGLVYLTLMTTAAFILRTPPPNYEVVGSSLPVTTTESPSKSITNSTELRFEEIKHPVEEKRNMSLIEALTSTEFKIMVVMFIGDISYGLILASRLSNIITDVFGKTPEEAATVVSVNGALNFVGRLSFSIISDYVGRKNCFLVMLTCQVVSLGCFSIMTNTNAFWPFFISIMFVTATYGGCMGVIPAFLTDKFGPENIGACHGIMIFGWAATGVIEGLTFTCIFNSLVASGIPSTDPIVYNANAWWLFGCACVGWIAINFVKPTNQDIKLYSCIKRFFCCRKTFKVNDINNCRL